MNKIEMLSVGALAFASAGLLGCASKQAAAAPSTESTPPATAAAPAASTPAEEPPAKPSEPGAATDDTWTDGAGATAGTATAPAAAPLASQTETRTMDVIRKFVQDRREKVRPCYDKVQASRPNLKGDVMMRFVLSPSGVVQNITYSESESTIFSKEIGDCIAAEMKTWQFPESSRGMETKVGYPFNFNPRKK